MKGRRSGHIAVWGSLVLFAACYGGLYIFEAVHWAFFWAGIAASAVYGGLVLFSLRRPDALPVKAPFIFLAAGVVFRLLLIPVEPIASDDVYRYIWDGKAQVHGFDPYMYAPIDEDVSHLHTTELPAQINFPEMKTIYPPLAQWVFAAGYAVGGGSVTGFKAVLFAAECITLALLFAILRSRKRLHWLVLYALCPLPILQFMVDAHMDALVLPFLAASVLLIERQKPIASLVSLGLSAMTKLLTLVFVPVYLRELPFKRWYLLGIPVLILALSYLPYIFGGSSPFESLGVYSMNWTFNGSVYPILHGIAGDNQIARYILLPILIAGVLVISYKNSSFAGRMYWVMFLYLALAPTVHPWYVIWLAMLLVLYPRGSGVLFVMMISVANFSGVMLHSSGIWEEPVWMPLVIYLPVLAMFIYEQFFVRRNLLTGEAFSGSS